ncbi:MAG: UDP-N-acetylmuramoyl-L-alanyl-D-glutamate--2,6-diaminopimelate ligase [Aquificaceae bacterium]|nr:UDP-N-acetylmuramoyl-L-alanyl-D-glutamate--2,6-diaminopimelate ligase [Aquificaceae bacterium]MDW8237224.1 UDP-N-acetylmuramoyl-L-alanyl-D-glutamate--2,6-diaminopimelate ligase [Aquificaceae bacterium]
MDLKEILKSSKGITCDSRKVRPGYLFFALEGKRFDGNLFIEEALRRGASFVLSEQEHFSERVLKVSNIRSVLADLSSEFYKNPCKELKLVGITGTNGKTTSSYIIQKILASAGFETGIIGTIAYRTSKRSYVKSKLTTPDVLTLNRVLNLMRKDGAKWVVMEVSSHALDQRRIEGCKFFAVGFTNLSRDHLDYHLSMENYFLAKSKLFTNYEYEFALINSDDSYGQRLIKVSKNPITFGKDGELKILNFKTGFDGSEIELSFRGKTMSFRSSLVGDFQAHNIAMGVAFGLAAKIDTEVIAKALKELYVPGRFETYKGEGFVVVIDYAHTPDALEKLLLSARKISKNRLICVFGAGGDRDRGKRPLMGEVASKICELCIITSDNPRSEEPMSIAKDIIEGFSGNHYILELDRKLAIKLAISLAKEGDVIVIAGKGHETYQEINGIRYPFNDSEIVLEALNVRP